MSNPVFDDHTVRKLAEILNETQLTEIEYAIGEMRIRVARQVTVQNQVPSLPPAVTGANASPAAPVSQPPPVLDKSQHPGVVKSPMVGTVYTAASPEMPPFIQVGSTVTKGQTILIIEAMKVMNQIKAPWNGKVKEIFFHNGEPVEYDSPLLILDSE